MKKLFFTIMLFISILHSTAQNDDYRNVIAVANAGLHEWLEKIPVGRESLYGFKNRDEFAYAAIGKAYEVKALSDEFFSDSFLTDKNYLVATGEWKLTISIKGENRAFIKVGMMKGAWKTVGFGSAGLAKEFGEIEKNIPSTNQRGIMLTVHQMQCDFILIRLNTSTSNLTVYPLRSAFMALRNQIDNNVTYSLPQMLILIKRNVSKIKN